MKSILTTCLILLQFTGTVFCQDTTQVDLTQIGQQVPEFTFITLDHDTVQIDQWKGNVTLINFFATWCGPCNEEIPYLEKDIWQKYKSNNFRLISIGREHTLKEVEEFKEEKKVTFPMAADPNREIYKKFATMYIPRNILIDAEGKIVYQERGFEPKKWKELVEQIDILLK